MLVSLLKNNSMAALKRALIFGHGTVLKSGIIKQHSFRIDNIKIAQSRRSGIGIASANKNDQDEESSHHYTTSKRG